MIGRFRYRLTYANVMATLAMFVALGGGAYAVATIGPGDIKKNAVRSKHIKRANVKGSDLAPSAVGSAKVADNALTGTDIDEATLEHVLRFGGTIPSGVTVRGVFACDDRNQQFDNPGPVTLEAHCHAAVTLPLPAPEPLTDADVNFAPGANGEDDPSCTGTPSAPTAPPGKVCLYQSAGINDMLIAGAVFGVGPSPYGFDARADSFDTTNAAASTLGTWAYTAP
jgi:hypothetical protein